MNVDDDAYQEIVAALLVLENRLRDIGGCSDGNCCIIKPQGMHTNGGCRCVYHARDDHMQRVRIEKALRNYQIAIEAIRKAVSVERTIDLRDRGKAR